MAIMRDGKQHGAVLQRHRCHCGNDMQDRQLCGFGLLVLPERVAQLFPYSCYCNIGGSTAGLCGTGSKTDGACSSGSSAYGWCTYS